MALLGVGLADAHPEGDLVLQLGVGQKEIPATASTNLTSVVHLL